MKKQKKQANRSIDCSVSTCRFQDQAENSCTLEQIKVGSSKRDAMQAAATECDSFEFAGELHPESKKAKNSSNMSSEGNSSLYGKNSMDANREMPE